MSKIVDERVVSMQFDNKNFESNVSKTMSTLDKLKAKLSFKGASTGLENIGKSVSKVNMSSLSSAVDTVSSRFSALEVVGITTIANLTNSVVNASKKIIDSFTLEPITSGFREYETQMGAIQTILANTQSKGSTLDDVNKALNELNKYADQTIYNFTEMTRNIGTFTAAGVGLEKSVTSIKGIANLAAISGSTSQQASMAMYQLSQALAAGRVSLMDWNSVVNAGMGGEVFQTALKRTATQMGYNVDAIIEKYGSFRESLTQGEWLTTEVLTETLTQLSGAYTEADLIAQGYTEQQAKDIMMLAETAVSAATEVKTFSQLIDTVKEAVGSGWAQTWQILIGDFEEAKELFSGIGETITGMVTKFSDARNNLLKGALGSKWDDFTDQIEKAGVSTDEFQAKLIEVANTHGISMDKMIEEEGSLKKVIDSGKVSKDLLIETLKSLSGAQEEAVASTENMTDKLEYFQKVVDQVWHGDYKNGEERIKALTEAGYDYAEVQALVNKTVDGHRLTLEDLSDTQLESVGYTKEEITAIRQLAEEAEKAGTPLNELINDLSKPTGRELLFQSFANILQPISTILKSIGTAWRDAFPPMSSDTLYNMIEGLNKFTQYLVISDGTANNLTRTLKGLFAVLDIVTSIFGGGFKAAFTIGTKVVTTLWNALGFANANILEITATVGDAIVAFRDWYEAHSLINKAIEIGVPLFVKGALAVADFIKSIYDLPAVQNVISKFSESITKLSDAINNLTVEDVIESFTNMAKNISKALSTFDDALGGIPSDILNGLVNGLKNGTYRVVSAISNIALAILNTIKSILGIHSPSTEMEEVGENTIEGLVNGLKDGISKVQNVMSNIASKIVGFLKNIDWGKVIAGGMTVGIFAMAFKLLKVVESLSEPFEGLGSVLEGFGNILDRAAKPIAKVIKSFSGLLKALSFNLKAQAIYTIAKSIAVLAGSIFLLAQLDTGSLWGSILALGALSGIIVALAFAMNRFGSIDIEGTKTIMSIIKISAALVIMSFALKQLSSIDISSYGSVLAGMAVIIVSFVGIMISFGKISEHGSTKNIDKLGSMMIKMSASLILMTVAIKLISGLDAGEIVKGGIAILSFVKVVEILGSINNKFKNIDKLGSMMIKMSAAMLLMVAVIKLVSGLSVGEILKGSAAILAFVGIIKLMAKVATTGNGDVAKFGGTLLAMSTSMLILVGVIKLVSGLSAEEVVKGSAAILAFVGILALMTKIVKMDGDIKKSAGTLLAMSVSIGILAAVCVVLSLIDLGGLAKGIVAVGMLSVFMAVMIKATKNANDVKGNIIAITVAISLMAVAVAALSFIDPSRLLGASLALSMLMTMFSVIAKSTGNMNKSISNLIMISAVVALLAVILSKISELPIESSLSNSAALSALLLSMSASMKIISSSGNIYKKSLSSIITMVALMSVLSAIMYMISGIDPNSALPNAIALGSLMIALATACVILSKVGPVASSSVTGAAKLIGMITIVSTVMVMLAGLVSLIPGVQKFLDGGIEVLSKIGYALGSFFGNIVGGFSAGATSGLKEIAENLKEFMDIIGEINPSSVDSAKTLAETMLILAGAGIADAIASFLSFGKSPMETFKENMGLFGEAIVEFSNTVSGNIDESSVTAASSAGKMLAEMNSTVPSSGGLISFFAGSHDLSSFSSQIVSFGKAIVEFSRSVSGNIDETSVIAASNAGKLLAEMNSTIPNTGGLVGFFSGGQDLTSFSNGIKSFGKAIVDFSNTLVNNGGINENSVTAAANAGTLLSEMNSTIPNTGGLISFFAGDNDLAGFGKGVKSFGEAIVGFSNAIIEGGGINENAVTAAANAGKIMAELQSALPETGGWFDNTQTLSDFGYDLANFGSKLAEYSSNISGADITSISMSIAVVNRLMDVIKNMSGLDTSGVKSFTEAINTLGNTDVNKFASAFSGSSVNADMVSAGAKLVESIANGMASKQSTIKTSAINTINIALNAVKEKASEFKSVGDKCSNEFISGLSKSSIKIKMALTISISSALASIRSYYSSFYSAGAYLVRGFANGISANSYMAAAKARAMANAASNAAKAALDVHSPSKVFYKIGDFAGIGFVNALVDNIKPSYMAGKEIANSAKNGLSNAIGRISDIINSDIDTQPTIRPVVDLSNVENSSRAINSMFGIKSSVGTLNLARSISSSMSNNKQMTNDDVVSAIKDLKRSMSNIGGTTYNSIGGITYDDGSNISEAIQTLIRAVKIERRV